MTNREPDFMFQLTVPINVPNEEERALIAPNMEDFIVKLVEAGHLSEEEAVAFVKFSSELGAYLPFMMDAFVQSYRSNKNNNATKRQLQEDAEAAKQLDSKKLIV